MTGAAGYDDTPAAPVAGWWKAGVNVPWTVSWTGETQFDLKISEDFPGLVDLVQSERVAEGAPRFRAMHVSRHRAAMATLLCHVCGKPTDKRDRYLFPLRSGGMAVMPDESLRYAGNVPPVHRRCAGVAAVACPHLRATGAEAVAWPAEPSRLMPRTDVIPGMEKLARTLPGNLRIVFSCYRLFGPKFSAMVGATRRQAGVDF